MAIPEFVFELHVCRWAELAWQPADENHEVIVARQLGTRRRRWDTIILECDPGALEEREAFGSPHLDSDLLHVVRHAPTSWEWYRDALPYPGYPWRYVRDAIHEADDREIIETRRRSNRIEIRRTWAYPEWVSRVIAIENKPDLDASAADALATQLEYDVALGLADEVWLATQSTPDADALFEAMPVEVGILTFDIEEVRGDVLWHPRRLDPSGTGTRILDRPAGTGRDQSAAEITFVDGEEKEAIRREIAERGYERGWRSAIAHMRTDCRHFALSESSRTHEPRCRAKGRAQRAGECHGGCEDFEPEPPAWRMHGWPIEGGPGAGAKTLYEEQRRRRR